jgi:regulator of sigma E protease
LVEEFSIGMGPRLFSVVRGETRYSLKLFPIGGSCRMLGDEPDEEDEAETNVDGEVAEPKPKVRVYDERSYNSKSVSRRILVIVAGVVMNILLAVFLSVLLNMNNGFYTTTVGNVVDGSPAAEAGLMVGDRITKVDGKAVRVFLDFHYYMQLDADGSPITVTVRRNGETVKLNMTPLYSETNEKFQIGFYAEGKRPIFSNADDIPFEKAGFFETVKYGVYDAEFYVRFTLSAIGRLITRQMGMEQMGGVVMIVGAIGESTETNYVHGGIMAAFWGNVRFAALISANLAVFNLLPIPALDGGRLVFFGIEAIRRKPVKAEVEGMIHLVGFAALMLFMLLITVLDIGRLF